MRHRCNTFNVTCQFKDKETKAQDSLKNRIRTLFSSLSGCCRYCEMTVATLHKGQADMHCTLSLLEKRSWRKDAAPLQGCVTLGNGKQLGYFKCPDVLRVRAVFTRSFSLLGSAYVWVMYLVGGGWHREGFNTFQDTILILTLSLSLSVCVCLCLCLYLSIYTYMPKMWFLLYT